MQTSTTDNANGIKTVRPDGINVKFTKKQATELIPSERKSEETLIKQSSVTSTEMMSFLFGDGDEDDNTEDHSSSVDTNNNRDDGKNKTDDGADKTEDPTSSDDTNNNRDDGKNKKDDGADKTEDPTSSDDTSNNRDDATVTDSQDSQDSTLVFQRLRRHPRTRMLLWSTSRTLANTSTQPLFITEFGGQHQRCGVMRSLAYVTCVFSRRLTTAQSWLGLAWCGTLETTHVLSC